ncbi:MAG: hypothetical protein M3Y65_01285 [Pseudomonadota bacterium]|nr:hypothetical protein [Pseudomonadota bacterium]
MVSARMADSSNIRSLPARLIDQHHANSAAAVPGPTAGTDVRTDPGGGIVLTITMC